MTVCQTPGHELRRAVAHGQCATCYSRARRGAPTRTPNGAAGTLPPVRMPAVDVQRVEDAAKARGETVAAWVRQAVRETLLRQAAGRR